MTTVEVFAPAKINLTLHVTGRRDDGYHLLDSLVAFADVGDVVSIAAADDLTLSVTGPMSAGVPTDARNLVWRAAGLMLTIIRSSPKPMMPLVAVFSTSSKRSLALP